jgi:hypothetical protein
MTIQALLINALRTGAQALWGILIAQAVSHGITIPSFLQGWFVETVIVAGGIALVTAALRWLETRSGESPGARFARFLAKILMAGLSKQQPVYTRPVNTEAMPEAVRFDDGKNRPAL